MKVYCNIHPEMAAFVAHDAGVNGEKTAFAVAQHIAVRAEVSGASADGLTLPGAAIQWLLDARIKGGARLDSVIFSSVFGQFLKVPGLD